MTKFILHGGATSRSSEDNENFYKEIVSEFIYPIRLLVTCFALPEELWEGRFVKTKKIFDEVVDNEIIFTLASSDTDEFVEQIKNTDVIFIGGGSEILLKVYFKVIPDFAEFLEGKVVVGSSAGVNIFSKYYYTNDRNRIENGLGILPIKTICHYDDSKKSKFEELDAHKESLKIYSIKEEEFFVLQK